MDSEVILSIIWKCSLSMALLALTALFIYLCAALSSIRKSLNSIQNTLNSTENLVNQEVGILINDVTQTVKEINKELPQLLQNINGITASLQQISENEIQTTLHNVQELTEALNHSIHEFESVVHKVSSFSGQTIEQAEYFRNQVAVSLADIIGLWHGVKAGWEKLYNKSSNSGGVTVSNTEQPEQNTSDDTEEDTHSEELDEVS